MADRSSTSTPTQHGPIVSSARAHPVPTYFVIAFAISWTAWIPWAFGYDSGAGAILFILGGFGPLTAALLVTRWTGGRAGTWLRGIFRARVPARYYAFALGVPLVVLTLVNVELAVIGKSVDLSLLPERLAAYAGTFLFVAVVGGGLEEPGWRGFALPRMQRRYSPLVATLLLGFVWGVWHIPAYRTPVAFVVPLVLAFFYTWLYNASGSIFLCILLHAGLTASLDNLVLAPDSLTVDIAIFTTYLVGVFGLVVATRGRLGFRQSNRGVGSTVQPRKITREPVQV